MRGIHGDHRAAAAAAAGQDELALGDPLAPRPPTPAERVLARATSASIDKQLAAGVPPESSRLLATRARDIVRPPRRQALARDWEHLLRVAQTRGGRPGRARPVRASQVAAAGPAVRQLTERLAAPLPVGARGVAMAIVLLTDATGPVYSRRTRETLDAALEAAIAHLDPARPVFT